jgi:hypothetical protein
MRQLVTILYILLLVSVGINITTWNYQLKLNSKILQFMGLRNTGNTVTYEGITYGVYGLEGAGKVFHKYPVYTPVYMSEEDYEGCQKQKQLFIYEASKAAEQLNAKVHEDLNR